MRGLFLLRNPNPPKCYGNPTPRVTVQPLSPNEGPTLTVTPTPTLISKTPPPRPQVSVVVGNTGGIGVSIRRTPKLEDTIKAWPDGTEMLVIGDDREAEGMTWKNVQDPDGNKGWVPSMYLLAAPTPTPTSGP